LKEQSPPAGTSPYMVFLYRASPTWTGGVTWRPIFKPAVFSRHNPVLVKYTRRRAIVLDPFRRFA